MTGFDEIKQICSDYIAAAEKVENERKPADGLFGMGKKPADDPCHDRFAEKLGDALKEIASCCSGSSEAKEILSYLYRLPKEHTEPVSIFWMLNAVHGLTLPLIDCLSHEDAVYLRKQYTSDYKRWERLPVQEDVVKALKART